MHGLEKDTIGGFNSMIEFEKKYGWQFLFLGTNMNAIDVPSKVFELVVLLIGYGN